MSATNKREEDGHGPGRLGAAFVSGALMAGAGLLFLSAARNTQGRRGKEGSQPIPIARADAPELCPVPSALSNLPVQNPKKSRPVRNTAPAHITSLPPVDEILGILSLWICCVAALVPFLFLGYMYYDPIDRGMDAPWMALNQNSKIVALVLVGAFCVYNGRSYWKALRHSPLGLLMRLLLLWAVTWAGVYILAFALNCALDFAPMNSWQTPVVRKIYQGPSGENSFSSYYLLVRDWKNPRGTLCLQVQESSYEQTAIGQTIRVRTHRGLWGAEWGWD